MAKIKSTIYYLIPLLAIIGGLCYFVIWPFYGEIKKINADMNDELFSLEGKKLKTNNIKEGLTDLNKIKDELSKTDIFIKKGDELSFIQEIEILADKYQIEQIPNIGTLQNEGSESFLPIKITLFGEFDKILKFINELDRTNYYLIVSLVNLTASDIASGPTSRSDFYLPTESSGNLTVELSGKIYYEQ